MYRVTIIYCSLVFLLTACTTANPDRVEYPFRGIDVSHHQDQIDWDAVANDDVSFAYVKATEGMDWTDERFTINITDAQKAGIRTGFYHFFTFCSPAEKQVKHFIASTKSFQADLPPALDLEFGGNCKDVPERDILLDEIRLWLAAVEDSTGMKPVIYTTSEFYEEVIRDEFSGYELWFRDLWNEPDPDYHDFIIWQYSNIGSVDGIDGRVDLNVMRVMP